MNELLNINRIWSRLLAKIALFFSSLFLLIVFNQCEVEEYDLENMSMDSLMIETSVDAPIAKLNISVVDILRHRGSSGSLATEDSVYDVANMTSEENIPLPAYVVAGTDIVAKDTLKDADFANYFGRGEILDSLIQARLKFNVENELPFAFNVELRFLHNDTILEGRILKFVNVEDTTLRRSFSIDGCKLDNNKKLKYATESEVKIDFDGTNNSALQKVNHIELVYSVNMTEKSVYLTKEATCKMNFSAYLRGRVLLND